jgi:NitT/TauT family transport system substrate-binding protein
MIIGVNMKRYIFSILILLIILTSCTKDTEKIEAIRIGIMPDAGALPLLLMDNVEVIPFLSSKERDTAMQLGELDGMMTDMVSVLAHNQKDIPMKVLSLTESRFMIVGTPEFTEDQTWTIGISDNTVIEYMVDQLADGISLDKVAIPQVPVRMEMLGSGKIPLACLTDAMAWPLLSRGFQIIRDQQGSNLEPAILAFSGVFLDKSEKRMVSFVDDWNKIAVEINKDPDSYRELLIEKVRLPNIEGFPYPLPYFKSITLPTEAQVNSVITWFTDKYGLDKPVTYKELMIQ